MAPGSINQLSAKNPRDLRNLREKKHLNQQKNPILRIILLTSTSLRHRYLAHKLSREFELELVVAEGKSEKIEDTSNLSEEDAAFTTRHFEMRNESEMKYFGTYKEFPEEVPVLELPHGQINSPQLLELVESINPDYIVLFGTSIIKSSLLDTYRSRIINLHLGLSPYYKGSATNLFPYYYGEPECIGATIHLASSEVDQGEILHQLRPNIDSEDDLHSIGNKTILLAGQVLPEVLKTFAEKHLTPHPQLPAGRICRIKELTQPVLRKIYQKFENEMLKEYLDDKQRRDAARPIVEGLGN